MDDFTVGASAWCVLLLVFGILVSFSKTCVSVVSVAMKCFNGFCICMLVRVCRFRQRRDDFFFVFPCTRLQRSNSPVHRACVLLAQPLFLSVPLAIHLLSSYFQFLVCSGHIVTKWQSCMITTSQMNMNTEHNIATNID